MLENDKTTELVAQLANHLLTLNVHTSSAMETLPIQALLIKIYT